MKNKKDRIAVIRDIIQSQSISSQDELLTQLLEKGFKVTQATLSRDLKQMQIAKIATREGGYMYVMPDVAAPGYASSIAYDIDMCALPEVMGTLAGDDTILVIPRSGFTTHQVAEALCAALPKS